MQINQDEDQEQTLKMVCYKELWSCVYPCDVRLLLCGYLMFTVACMPCCDPLILVACYLILNKYSVSLWLQIFLAPIHQDGKIVSRNKLLYFREEFDPKMYLAHVHMTTTSEQDWSSGMAKLEAHTFENHKSKMRCVASDLL